MNRLTIVGGGISGLAAAQGAREAWEGSGELEITVLERDSMVGGKARTLKRDGWLVETGPAGYLNTEPVLDRLVAAAGLESDRLLASQEAARRFLIRDGELREVHAHPLRFLRSGLLSPVGLGRLALEPIIPRRKSKDDESIWGFANRRLGRQAADRLIAPMVQGIFAGNAKEISLPAAFPRLAEIEAEHGSLIRGMIAIRRAGKSRGGGPAGPGGGLVSFRDGLQDLPLRLSENGAFTVELSTSARAIETTGSEWRVRVDGHEPVRSDALVLAGEAWAMIPLLKPICSQAADTLETIPYPPVGVVALGYGAEALERIPRGFGVLIPHEEKIRMLGCLWDTHVFPGRSPRGKLLVRSMVGGALDPDAARRSRDELIRAVRVEVERLFGLTEPPEFEECVIWPRAIPQYTLGHDRRAATIESALEQTPGLFLAGNAVGGVAFAKAAATGYEQGRRAARYIAHRRASHTIP